MRLVIRLIIPAAIMSLLCGCAHVAEPKVITKEVPVIVTRSCVPEEMKSPPETPDSITALLAAPESSERYRLMGQGWAPKEAWIALAAKVIEACRG